MKEYTVMTLNKSDIENAFNFRYAESFREKVKERIIDMTDEEMKVINGYKRIFEKKKTK